MIFYFFDGGAQIENKTALIFPGIGKILDFLLPDKIVDSGAVLLIDQSLTSKQDAVTGDNIKLVEDDDISGDKFMGADSVEAGILIVDENILLIFDIVGLFLFNFDSHLELLFNLFNSIEIIFNNLTFMFVYLRFIFT